MARTRTGCSGCGCLTLLICAFLGTILFRHVLGGVIGFLFGLFILNIFGSFFAGRRSTNRGQFYENLDEFLREYRQRRQSQGAGVDSSNLDILLALHMAVIRQNPEGNRDIHRETALRFLHNYAQQLGLDYSRLVQQFQDWGNREIDVKELAGRASREFPERLLKAFLRDLIFVAYADGQLAEDEQGMLEFIGKQFGFTESEVRELLDFVRRQFSEATGGRQGRGGLRSEAELEAAYETLDLLPSASPAEVEKKYKELARKYHPDKFKDESEAARELAEEKMIEINQAYKQIQDSEKY